MTHKSEPFSLTRVLTTVGMLTLAYLCRTHELRGWTVACIVGAVFCATIEWEVTNND